MTTPATSARGAGRAWALVAGILFSTGGVAIKGTALTALQVAGFRSGVAAAAIYLLMPSARRGYSLALVPAALAYAATLVCFVVATKLTTAASAIFLQSTAPIWVLVLGPALLREPIRRTDLPYVGLVGLGLVLVFVGSRGAVATAPMPALGNAFALASGLSYALLMMLVRRLATTGEPGQDRSLAAMVMGNLIALAACLPLALPVEAVTPRDLGSIVYLGLFQIALAYWAFARGLRALSALEVSLLVLIEPILNPIWTWLVHDERPTALALTGGAVMMTALAARALLDRPPATGPAP